MKFKKIISALIGCSMLISTTAFAETDFIILPNTANIENIENMITFSDLPSTHWAYNDVMTIANKGIISGTTTPVNGVGTYDPDGTVTLGQFLAIATRLVASDKIQDGGEYAHWSVPNYMAAVEVGLITPQQFACTPELLDTSMSREDMAMVLVKIAEVNGENLEVKLGIENNISDYSEVDILKRDAVRTAYSNGLLTGKGNNRFAPKDQLTRAEVAAVFCRVMNYTNRPVVMIQSNPTGTGENTQVTQDEYSKYVVTEEVETKGVLRPTYSDQYNKEAMNSVKYGEDANGVYVEVTAPILPDVIKGDFKIVYTFRVEDSNGDYFAEDIVITLGVGETKKVYFNSFEDTKISGSNIGNASVVVSICNASSGSYLKSFSVDTHNKVKGVSTRYDGTNPSVIDYNSSHIFVGIGK